MTINLHTIRKLIEYSFKNVLVKAMFTLIVLEILLFEGRLVLSPAQRGTRNEIVKVNINHLEKALKAFIKFFEAPQRSEKIKI